MKSFVDAISKLIGFRLTAKGVGLLVFGGVIGFGVDYFLNSSKDYRLMIFIIGVSIFMIFILNTAYLRIKYHFATRKAVKKLTQKEYEYVLSCDSEGQYIECDLSNAFQIFNLKWKYILFVPTTEYLVTGEEYRICVSKKALKLIKRKIEKQKMKHMKSENN